MKTKILLGREMLVKILPIDLFFDLHSFNESGNLDLGT
jgi:hypothetical protein